MKTITKKVDNHGRIVLPINVRKAMGLSTDSEITMGLENGVLTIKKSVMSCKLCNSTRDLDRSICVCGNCIKKIKLM